MTRTRKNTRTSLATNRKMNDATYALRRQVMDVIYHARKLVDNMPRVEVRIADMNESNVVGLGRMGDNVVWISAKYLESHPSIMHRVVLHEVLHAVKAQEHVQGCPLMGTHVDSKASDEAIDKLFVRYMTA